LRLRSDPHRDCPTGTYLPLMTEDSPVLDTNFLGNARCRKLPQAGLPDDLDGGAGPQREELLRPRRRRVSLIPSTRVNGEYFKLSDMMHLPSSAACWARSVFDLTTPPWRYASQPCRIRPEVRGVSQGVTSGQRGRVGNWRGDGRPGLSVGSPFPLGVPHQPDHGSVSSFRRLARGVRISRTTRSCRLLAKGYET